jgi:hypothetical protein
MSDIAKGKLLVFRPRPAPGDINYFGECPIPGCRGNDGYLNLEREHWFRCDRHRTKWIEGMNLFSSWREETEADWARNAAKLAAYRQVEPLSGAPPAWWAPTRRPMPAGIGEEPPWFAEWLDAERRRLRQVQPLGEIRLGRWIQ